MDAESAREIEEKIADLKKSLGDLKGRNPAHCSGTRDYVGHQMSQKLFQQLEDIEEEIKELEGQLKQAQAGPASGASA